MSGRRRAGGKRAAGRPAQPAPPTIALSRPPTRREARAERRRQQRRRLGAGGIAAVAVLVLAVLAGGGFFVHRATSGGHTSTDPQPSLLIAFEGDDHSAIVGVLAAHQQATKQGFELLIPSRLLTDVCGYGTEQFGRLYQLPDGTALAQRTMSQVLGDVHIDGSLVIGYHALISLVNAVGGVTVDIDTDVIQQSGGSRVVVVPKGPAQHLDGARAAAFAAYVGSGEAATANLSRFQAVLEAVITSLPAKPAQSANMMRAAGVGPAGVTQASTLFSLLASDDSRKALLPTELPTQPIDTGGGTSSYRLDTTAISALVKNDLGPSLPANSGQPKPTVLIENGVGTPGLVLSACNRLLPNGFTFAHSGNAPHFGYTTSQIVVSPPNSAAAAELGDRIATLLRLPSSDVVASAQGNNVADVVIVLGRDYKP